MASFDIKILYFVTLHRIIEILKLEFRKNLRKFALFIRFGKFKNPLDEFHSHERVDIPPIVQKQ